MFLFCGIPESIFWVHCLHFTAEKGSDVAPLLLNDFITNHFFPLGCKQRSCFILFFFLSVTVSKHSSQKPGPASVTGHQQMSGSHYKFKENLTKGPLQRCSCGLRKSIVPGLTTQRGHYCPWAWRRRVLERQLLEGDLINTLMLGKIEGKRRTWQQKMRLLDRISDSMDMNLSKLQKIVEDRRAWYATIHRAIKSWRDLATEQQQSNENLAFGKGKGNIF